MDQPEGHQEPPGAGQDAHGRDRQQEGMREGAGPGG